MADDLVEGRYRRLRVLGRGAMGEVWLAEDVMLHRQVAVKSITPGLRAPEQIDLDRMLREARLAARLNHPHVVGVYDLSIVDGVPQVVMEYVPGRTLADEIREHGQLSCERTAAVGLAVADALAEAHELGIVHRDVKPANIMITPRGVPKIADFGIARVTDDTGLTDTGIFIGTPAYVAPEIVGGAPADARSDLWALGVTLWAMLEGRTPFEQDAGEGPFTVLGRVLNEPAASPPRGGYLAPVVMQLLDRDPARRPTAVQTTQLLRTATRRPIVREQREPQTTRFPPPGRAPTPTVAATARARVAGPAAATAPLVRGDDVRPPRRRRHAALLLAALVVLAAVVVGAVVLTTRTHGSSAAGRTGGASVPAAGSASGSRPPSASSSPSAAAAYSGPGGVAVRGPAGWRRDSGAGIANIRDYDAPGGDRITGTYFRIGIGNPKASTIEGNEGETALQNLSLAYTDVRRLAVTAVSFLGVRAYDVEATGVSRSGISRHLVERVWISDGIERIVQLNAAAGEWARYSPVFAQLVSTCTVT